MRVGASSWALVVAGALLVGGPTAANARGGGGDSYLLLGGGGSDFTRAETRDLWRRGGSWDARLGYGLQSPLGAEVAYVGSLNGARPGSYDLMGNGAEAVLRLLAPFTMSRWLIEPFAFGGIGFDHLALRNAPAGFKNTENIGDVPFGGGVTLGIGHVLLDARFTYRATFNEGSLGSLGSPELRNWAVTGAIGVRF